MRQDLREYTVFQPTLVEETGDGGAVVEGVFQQADVLNANKRVYPRGLWEKILQNPEVLESMRDRRMYGELDHPADWRMTLGRAAHIIIGLRMNEDGKVIGRAEILPTPQGEVLAKLFKAKCKVGISSRGTGSTTRTNEGHEVVQDDFQLETFDFVATPSTPGAFPRMVMETIEKYRIHDDKGGSMPEKTLKDFHEAEREAKELVAEDVSKASVTFRKLLMERVEASILKLADLEKNVPGVDEMSGPALTALRAKRLMLSPFAEGADKEKGRMAKPKLKEDGPENPMDAPTVPDYDSETPQTAEDGDGDDTMPDFIKKKIAGKDDKAAEAEIDLDLDKIFEGSSSSKSHSHSSSSSSDSDDSHDEFSFDSKSEDASGDDSASTSGSSMDPMGMDGSEDSDEISSTMSGDMSREEDSETVSDAEKMITANIPLKISVEQVNKQIERFMKEDVPDQVSFDASSTDHPVEDEQPSQFKKSADSDDTDEDASNALPPPADPGPDIVSKTEAEIKAMVKILAKNPEKVEALFRHAIKQTNKARVAEHKGKQTIRRFNKVAEAMVRRYRTVKKNAKFVEAKYGLALEAISDLRERHLTLRKKAIIHENLRDLPKEVQKEWMETLVQAPTMNDLVVGLKRVKAAYKDKKVTESTETKQGREKTEETPVVRLSESREKRGSLGKGAPQISEGAKLFRNVAANGKRGLK